MFREMICPHCGASSMIDEQGLPDDSLAEGVGSRTIEMVLPATISTDSIEATSGQDTSIFESLSTDSIPGPEGFHVGNLPISSAAMDPSESDITIWSPVASKVPQGHSSPGINGSGSSDRLATFAGLKLDLSAPPAAPPIEPAAHDVPVEGAVDDPVAVEDNRPSAWPIALLSSYASVMTLICLWMWWDGRSADFDRDTPDLWAVEEGPDPGVRSNRSIKVEPVPEIPDELRVGLDRSIQVDSLEITPLEVRLGQVILDRLRVDGRSESKPVESNVLRLRVQLRNISTDTIFAPLDEAFVRDPDQRHPDTFLEDSEGRRVYTYELPIHSEWAIRGQEFRELRPGEVMEGLIVSSSKSLDALTSPLTWRLRLRTAPDRTEFLGITFLEDDIQAEHRP
ncbi:hypothetical protein BH23PLA1_BH23PLA1_13390 [soil metagenome]